MKKWRIIKIVTISLLIIFVAWQAVDAWKCTKMTYPHLVMGMDAGNWFDQYLVNLAFTLMAVGVPLIIDVVLMVISIIKTRKR